MEGGCTTHAWAVFPRTSGEESGGPGQEGLPVLPQLASPAAPPPFCGQGGMRACEDADFPRGQDSSVHSFVYLFTHRYLWTPATCQAGWWALVPGSGSSTNTLCESSPVGRRWASVFSGGIIPFVLPFGVLSSTQVISWNALPLLRIYIHTF